MQSAVEMLGISDDVRTRVQAMEQQVVGDAMFDQRELSIQIVQARGGSHGCFKDNQEESAVR